MSEALLKFLSLTEVWLGALGLAAFLAIFWVLRGAPVGQAVHREDDEDAPRGGYRDRVVAAMTVGLLLIGLGAYLAVSRGPGWSIPAFVLGFGTVRPDLQPSCHRARCAATRCAAGTARGSLQA